MNKIVSTKTTNALFLTIVLVTGTITALSSSSFMIGADAQAQPYYDDRMDNDYNSYGPTDYGMDKDKKPSGTDSYKSQYSSYKPDYKPVKDDKRDKSKDSKSVNINKVNCINTNLNINGENAGNVSIGNKDAAADEGYVGGGYSSVDDSEGYGSGDGYYNDGYNKNKKDNGFDCIINNNNNNINIIGGGGNVTEACEDCFSNLTSMQIDRILAIVNAASIGEYCDRLAGTPNSVAETDTVISALQTGGTTLQQARAILSCLLNEGVIGPRPEICNNGLDDDGNGLIDSADPACQP